MRKRDGLVLRSGALKGGEGGPVRRCATIERREGGFTLVELLVVILIIGLLAALLMPAVTSALCSAKQGAAEVLVDQLSQAAKAFEIDHNSYPPGKGDGSKTLVDALSKPGPRKIVYFTFRPDMLDAKGHIMSPIRSGPGGDILFYRNNVGSKFAGAHNKDSFDIWCRDCGTTADGVNNW